jgi:DNA-binding transcriptional regulator YhcF (GntR family)
VTLSAPKYRQAAERVRAMVADGSLLLGQSPPSGAALARETGYSVLTCRKALRMLIKDGVLVPGTSPGARPRVPAHAAGFDRCRADAARALSGSLTAFRRAAGLTQPQLADIIGMSVTTIGHAETGRLWQSRCFWELADKAVCAGGELLALHDAYRSSATPARPAATDRAVPEREETGASISPPSVPPASASLTCVTLTWADGTVTTVYPPYRGDTGLAEQ